MSEVHRSFGPVRATPVEPVRREDGSIDIEASVRKADRVMYRGWRWAASLLPGFRGMKREQRAWLRAAYARLDQPPTE